MPDETKSKPQGLQEGQSTDEGQPVNGHSLPTPRKPQLTPIQAIVTLLKRGHREMLPRLRELLREQPEVWQYVGNLAGQSRRAWIELAGGQDDLFKESAALYADERVMEIESDRFQNLSYPEPAFKTEAGAVYGEYRKNRMSPMFTRRCASSGPRE